MDDNRLGFLSSSSIIAGLLALVIVVSIGLALGGVLFSPGPLNAQKGALLGGVTSHADLRGKCSACHSAPWQQESMADRCEVCHTDITAQQKNAATLHGNLEKSNSGLVCRDCHREHGGPLTDISKANVAHNSFGYALTAHKSQADVSAFTCNGCHNQNYSTFDLKVCITCHQSINAGLMQAHLQDYGDNCLACHDGIDKYGHNFDHSKVSFELAGKHSQVACNQCHLNTRRAADFLATPTDCAACHAKDNPHSTLLGTNCISCHTASGWLPATFDHNLAAYPLEGKHSTVPCASCHVNNVYRGIPTDCYSCHKNDDKHSGQFGTDCSLCHKVSGWTPANFDHNQFSFKLTGKHVNVVCISCHTNSVFKGTPSDCASCHVKNNPHSARLGTNCASCHTTGGWLPATFDHNLAAYPLAGKHSLVPCASCHVNNVYRGIPTDCYSCHKNDDKHSGQYGTDCSLCHKVSGWTPANFDHNVFSFKLTGKHVSAACTACHANSVFKGTPSDCASCHGNSNPHSALLGTSCASCHTTGGWLPAAFDHNLAAFKLTGQHTQVSCAGCHVNNVYKGTPSSCNSCHSKDDSHGGQYGTNCASCHTTNAWLPATFDHNLSAFKLTGQHTQVSCASCHVNNVFKGTPTSCNSCHSKDDAHSGQYGTNCASCHTTSGWKPANFDHSGFPLTAGHSGLSCNSCHSSGNYAGLSTACSSCHSEPAYHSGLFSSNCAQCHSTSNWNASYTGSHPNNCDGSCLNHHGATCRDCHTSNLSSATCTKCHDSNKPGGGD